MAYEPKEGSGALFKNTRKEAENHPDYTGNCVIGGKVMRLAAWIKEGKQGKFMSISIKPDDQQRKPEPAPKQDPFAGDIPF